MRPSWKMIALSLAVLASGARAQSAPPASSARGWSIQVRVIPNPMPNGRCGGITVEIHDQDGYRVTPLSNGDPADSRRFVYSNSNPSAFSWKDGDSTQSVVCANASAPDLSRATIGVTTPDGMHDQVELTSEAARKSRPPVIYTKQAPLRLPGSPPKYVPPGTAPTATVAVAPVQTATTATMTTSVAPAPPPASDANPTGATRESLTSKANSMSGQPPTLVKTKSVSLTTAPMTVVFPYHSVPPITITSAVMAVNGVYIIPPPVVLTSPPIVVVGAYGKLAAAPKQASREKPTTHAPKTP